MSKMEDPTRKDIHEINRRIDQTEKSVGLLLRANRGQVIDELMRDCFRNSVEKVRVFLLIDGELSNSEIATKLNVKRPNVSRHIAELIENDLISLRIAQGSKLIYEKTSQARRLRLEKYLRDKFKDQLANFEKEPSEDKQSVDEGASESPSSVPGT